MRFCMVTTFYPPYHFGGDAVFVQQLARDLVDRGHEVEVVHCADAWRARVGFRPAPVPEHDPGMGEDGVVVHRLRSKLGRLSPLWTQQFGQPGLKHRALARVLARDFDVVHYHNISLIGGPGVLALGGAAKVYTTHEHWWVCPTHTLWRYTDELCTRPSCLRCTIRRGIPPQGWRAARSWMALCLSHVDRLLAPSRFTAERHTRWMKEARVDVPLEVLPGYTAPLEEASHDVELPERYFLYVGRLERSKGVDWLVRAFQRRPKYALVVVGDGPLSGKLRELGSPNVDAVGPVARSELGAYYRRALALIVPTRGAETFGLSACEAMSAGTPVLTSRCGGTEEVVGTEAGFVFADEDELSSLLDSLWNDAELRARLGHAARRRHGELYSRDRHLASYMDSVERARRHREGR